MVAGEALIEPYGSFDGLNDLQYARRAVRVIEFEAPGIAAVRNDEAGASQALQDLRQELLGAIGGDREIAAADARTRREAGKVNHHSHGVVSSPG